MTQITINRSADKDEIIVNKDGKEHTFQLSPLTKSEKDRVREMVVNHWCIQNGFDPVY